MLMKYSIQFFDPEPLIAARKQRGLTQQDIAQRTGLSRTQIVAMEKGTFSGGVKYLHRYLIDMGLMVSIVANHPKYPEFEQLAEIFGDD